MGAWTKEHDDAVLAKRARVKQGLAAIGRLGPVARFMPSSAAVTVRAGREPMVIDGPFAETKELVGGFFLVDVPTREEAVAIAAECPAAQFATIEVREFGACYE